MVVILTARRQLDRIRKRFREIRETDFFNSACAHEIEMLLRKGEGTERNKGTLPKLSPRDYRGKTWVTRPGPAIDRVGSAWLIRKFIEARARLVFS